MKSPAYDLNRILSGSLYKSVQSGTHTGLVGPEASGKSSFMALILADAQKRGYLPVIIDAEGAWDSEFVSRWGIDPNNVVRLKTLWVEEVMPELTRFIDGGITNLAIAVDSIGALESRKVVSDGVDKNDVKADQGRLQKEIKRMLKLLVSMAKFNDCLVFSAGHYYGNPSGYGEPEQIGGGKYYRLACDTIVSLKKSPIYENPNEKIKAKKGKILGTQITAATLKNRKYPPFQEAVVEIDYKNGVNEMAGLLDVAMSIGMVQRSGAWYTCEPLGIKAQGEVKFNEELSKIDKQPLLDAIEEHLKTTGYSSVNRELEMQEEQSDRSEPKPEETQQDKKVEEESTTKKSSGTRKKGPGRPKKNK